MGADILELCGKSHRGDPVMCHVVALGAHDGRPGGTRYYGIKKLKPKHTKQYKSWFDPNARNWFLDDRPIVGQIFFTFGDRTLDYTSDRIVLDAVVANYRFDLDQRIAVELDFVGHADARGSSAFNLRLGQQRAEVVRRYVDSRMQTSFVEQVKFSKYKSRARSYGEELVTGDHAADRRVDIVLKSFVPRTNVEIKEPLLITGENRGPLTRKLLFRPWGGGGAGIGKVGIEALEIEIKNPNTGAAAFYQYIGGTFGIGAPVSVSLPSADYTAKEVPFGFVDVDDFEGPGSIDAAMLGGGVQCLIFAGPKLHHSRKVIKKEGVEFCFKGWDLQAGASLGLGHWSRLPYRTPEQRREFLARQAKMRQERERFGPKY